MLISNYVKTYTKRSETIADICISYILLLLSLDGSLLNLSSTCRHNSVGVPTHYGLDSPGVERRWGRDFLRRPWGIPSLLYNGYRLIPGFKTAGA